MSNIGSARRDLLFMQMSDQTVNQELTNWEERFCA